MKRCIIVFSTGLLNHVFGFSVRSQDSTMTLHEARNFEEVLQLVGNTATETYLFVENYLLGIHLEERIKAIYKKNSAVKVCCVVLGKLESYYGLRLARSGIDSIICDVEGGNSFIQTIKSVLLGVTYYPPHILDALKKREYILNPQFCGEFTQREKQILETIIQGKTIKETSVLFDCSTGTISSMRYRVMQKIGAQNNADVIRFAYERGILLQMG